jgi:uncharacterized protein (DUF362 family)
MSAFLHILPVQNGEMTGDLSRLSAFYDNDPGLKRALETLLQATFSEANIKDKRIFIKPNWVKHSSKPSDDLCLRTHDSFTLAVVSFLLNFKPAEIVIGDAPIQGCHWDRMLSPLFQKKIQDLSEKHTIPIHIRDFRRRIYHVKENKPLEEVRPLEDYVIFDLGKKSQLEAITKPGKNRFRVTNYNPDRMSIAHAPGIHKYCITKMLFDADVVISLPKVKTHQKTGITCALKNIVGINGDKDFLPHHRMGGTETGGDCYPGGSYLRYWSELAMDEANRAQGTHSFRIWQKLSSLLWKLSFPGPEHQKAAGWYGNDTCWRMVLDLNKIVKFGSSDGSISDKPRRLLYSICDGIIGGQGDGPLDPEPLPMGIISCTNDFLVNDQAMATLMSLPPNMIPVLVNHNSAFDHECEILYNGNRIDLESLKKYAVKARPPLGWINYFNTRR